MINDKSLSDSVWSGAGNVEQCLISMLFHSAAYWMNEVAQALSIAQYVNK